MASEQVLEIAIRRYIFTSSQPFPAVLDGIFDGISQPDIGQLFSRLAASTSYEEFASLVQQAQGSVGLMRFLQLDLDQALTLDPQAPDVIDLLLHVGTDKLMVDAETVFT